MKIELKHLAPYLPYKLMIDNQFDERRIVMNATNSSSKNWIGIGAVLKWQSKCKPILRPLSVLTSGNDIYEMIEEYASGDLRWIIVNDLNEITYSTMQLLLQHHFDVFGLIEKGLAIDYNTLNN